MLRSHSFVLDFDNSHQNIEADARNSYFTATTSHKYINNDIKHCNNTDDLGITMKTLHDVIHEEEENK